MSTLRLALALAVLSSIGFRANEAHAEVPLSLDLDYAAPVDAGPVGDGFGGQLRFGPRLDLKLLTLAAEMGLGVHDFSGPTGPTFYRGVVGTRLGLGFLLRPSVFAHLGIGHLDWSGAPDLTHLTFDVGASLDLTLTPAVELGAHAAYNFLFGNGSLDSFGAVVVGGHVTIVLGRHDHDDDNDYDDDYDDDD